jgi:hypothetical protein
MFRFLVAAALIGSVLFYAKEQHVLDRAGILGSCAPLTVAAPKDSVWWECRPGKLTGYPDRSKDNCTRGVLRGEVRYWLCPAPLVAGRRSDAPDTG